MHGGIGRGHDCEEGLEDDDEESGGVWLDPGITCR